MNLVNFLDKPIAYHRTLANLTGSIAAAVLLSQACFWQRILGDWWKKRDKDWIEETGLTCKQVRAARKRCERWLSAQLRGVPAKSYYRLDTERLTADLLAQEEGNLVCLKGTNCDGQKGQTEMPKRDKLKERGTVKNRIESTPIGVAPPVGDAPPQAQSPESKVNGEGPSDHQLLIANWCQEYEQHFGRPYMFAGGKDGAAVKRILKAKVAPGDFLEVARRAWARADREQNGQRAFWCKQAATICGLAAKWNEVQFELSPSPTQTAAAIVNGCNGEELSRRLKAGEGWDEIHEDCRRKGRVIL